MPETTVNKLEALIAKVEKAILSVNAGQSVNLQAMDAESKTLHAELKKNPSAEARPLLLKAVTALERLVEALEKQVASKRKK